MLLPEDCLGSVFEYLLVEESIRCSLTNKDWSITAIFILNWMYKQGRFEGKQGKQYLQPPLRTAGRVVNFRGGPLEQQYYPLPKQQQQQQHHHHPHHLHHHQQQHRGRKRTKSRPTLLSSASTPPIAPSSPSPSICVPPRLFTTMGLQFNFNNDENNFTTSTTMTTMTAKPKRRKKRKAQTKNNPSQVSRPPLAPTSNNVLPKSSAFEQRGPRTHRSKSSPPKMKGTTRHRGTVVHVIAAPPRRNLLFCSAKTGATHTPKTPVGKAKHGRSQRVQNIQKKNGTTEQKRQSKKNKFDGSPYQYYNMKTSRLGTILSALGGQGSKVQMYYIDQHRPRTIVRRSTVQTSGVNVAKNKNISFGRTKKRAPLC